MSEREKVIKALKNAIKSADYEGGIVKMSQGACQIIIELLKGQEPQWISVKDGPPKEHPSLFAKYYGTEKWNNAMWRTESDRVLVTILFPDGTRTVDKGKLQDGEWRTGVSPTLQQKVTHWALWPEPPKEGEMG